MILIWTSLTLNLMNCTNNYNYFRLKTKSLKIKSRQQNKRLSTKKKKNNIGKINVGKLSAKVKK